MKFAMRKFEVLIMLIILYWKQYIWNIWSLFKVNKELCMRIMDIIKKKHVIFLLCISNLK